MKICNLCGSKEWTDMNNRKKVRCEACKSLERGRAMGIILSRTGILKNNMRILHFAPEKAIYDYIYKHTLPAVYDAFDLDPTKFSTKMNVKKFDLTTDLPFLQDSYYDLILHSHVMEHIPCNFVYIIYNLFRSLKKDGLHVACIPFLDGYYSENFGNLSNEEAKSQFGQFDHVRKFGNCDINRHIGLFIKMPAYYDLTLYASAYELENFNIPKRHHKGFHASTILVNKKDDYLLPL